MNQMQHWRDTICLLAGVEVVSPAKQKLRRATQELEAQTETPAPIETVWSRMGRWRIWSITYPGHHSQQRNNLD